jgi:CRISPR/Cas system-associated exonuclease Cas4 (RecB family)
METLNITFLDMIHKSHFLSKSKYLSGLQCPKKLWLEIHRPDLILEVAPTQQKIFDQGAEVGRLAREGYSGGVLISADHQHISEAFTQTKEALACGKGIIFEAVFSYDGTLVRPDVIRRTASSTWEMIEVKSTTQVKEEHYPDVAVQTYVLKGAGLDVNRTFLQHINNECVYPDLSNLFTCEEITDEVNALLPEIPGNLTAFREVLERADEPDVPIGSHCDDPHDCEFRAYCWAWVPQYSIFNLSRLSWAKKNELLAAGNVGLEKLPDDLHLSEAQTRFVESYETKQPVVDWAAIKKELSRLTYPLHFLDFETDNPAIPRLEGMHPYEQMPFQFSCHIMDDKGNLEHRVYLHETESDPRRLLLESLREAIGKMGTIIAYSAGFEKGILNNLAAFFPEYKNLILNWTKRLWDQLAIFRKYYTDFRFGGSNSIKDVLPVLIPAMNYQNLEVGAGGEAQVAWNEMIRMPQSPEKDKLIHDLKIYCGQDTMAMVEIHKFLQTKGRV